MHLKQLLTFLSDGSYRSLKVCVRDENETSPIRNEIAMLKRLEQSAQDHPGSAFVRKADDIFEVDGFTGSHQCIVTKPQGCSLLTLQHLFPDGKLPKDFVRAFVHRIVGAINWLHVDCGVVHTGTGHATPRWPSWSKSELPWC